MNIALKCTFAALFLLLIARLPLHAQPADVRLSTEPYSLILPEEIQIQSADVRNDTTLVVWGTTENRADGSVGNLLVAQLLSDTTRVGTQFRVTAPEAHPFGFLKVVATDSLFLIIWNDRRLPDSGLYMQRVTPDGMQAGPAVRLQNYYAAAPGMVVHRFLDGVRLVWNQSTPDTTQIYTLGLDHLGNPISDVEGPYAGTLRQASEPTRLPGILLLHREPLAPLYIDPLGRLQHLPETIAERFGPPFNYHLGEDGSLLLIDGDSVLEYETLFAQGTLLSRPLPIIEGAHSESMAVSRDTAGIPLVIFSRGGSGYRYNDNFSTNYAAVDICRLPISTLPDTSDITTLRFMVIAWPHPLQGLDIDYQSAELEKFCGNRTQVRLKFHLTSSQKYDTIVRRYFQEFNYTLNGFAQVTGYYSLISQNPVPPDPYCFVSQTVPIARVDGKHSSQAQISTLSGGVTLASPAAKAIINIPQATPSIFVIDREILTGWHSLNQDSSTVVGIWKTSTHECEQKDTVNITDNFIHPLESTSGRILQTLIHDGHFILSRKRQQRIEYSPDRYYYPMDNLEFYLPSTSGWLPFSPQSSTIEFTRINIDRTQYNPGTRETALIIGRLSGDHTISSALSLIVLDSTGKIVWEESEVAEIADHKSTDIVPIGNREYIIIYQKSRCIWKRQQDTILEFSLPDVWYTTTFRKLIDSSFLRVQQNGGELWIDGFTISGTYIPGIAVELGAQPGQWEAAQNPSDSGFAVVYACDSGIFALRLDNDLSLLGPPVRVSRATEGTAHPAAAFRNDSLFVIWEDSRNGATDIYGNVVTVQTTRIEPDNNDTLFAIWENSRNGAIDIYSNLVPIPPTLTAPNNIEGSGRSSHASIAAASPNPASTYLAVGLEEIPADGGFLELVNIHGERILRQSVPPGTRHLELPVAELPAGSYRLLLRTGKGIDSVPVAVVR